MFKKSNKKQHNMSNNSHNSEKPKFDRTDENGEIIDDLHQAEDQTVEQEEETMIESQENEIDKLTKDLDTVNAALEKEKKEYLFLMAEFDNFRKRTVKEKGELIRSASAKALEALLPIVDDFERGIEANKNAEDAETIKQGMELIYNKLVKYLEQQGVKPIPSTGEDFNPDLHEAIAMIPAQDESQKGKVIDTPTKGYTLNGDNVLRHAKVVVAQ